MSERVPLFKLCMPSFQVTFREAMEGPDRNQEYVFTRVKCFPLFSLLLAINATAFNYLSLDAEGAEIQVIKLTSLKLTLVGCNQTYINII